MMKAKFERYFSFQYSFWDATKKRNRPGVWNVTSTEGFPQAEKLLWDIEAYLLSMNVNVEKETVCLHGWQEFNDLEDYENFTK